MMAHYIKNGLTFITVFQLKIFRGRVAILTENTTSHKQIPRTSSTSLQATAVRASRHKAIPLCFLYLSLCPF